MAAHHHHHHHHQAEEVDWDAMAAMLERSAELDTAYLTQAAAWLRSLSGGICDVERVLDVGSGPGVTSCLFAATFPQARIAAVDGTPGLLKRAQERAARLGFADRVGTLEVDLPAGFDSLGTADLVWTSRTVHHLGDQQAAVDALARTLRPGGVLAIAEGGLPRRFLPRDIGIGRPGLQARLEAAHEEWFCAMRASLPGTVETVEDWPAMLARAGLVPTGSRTFLTDRPAPLDTDVREYLHQHLTRMRETAADLLDADDVETLDALLDNDSPAGIMWRPDAFYLAATTVHTGRRCRKG